jgi:glycine/D-amino acid oxidase-like deaminating enzyme
MDRDPMHRYFAHRLSTEAEGRDTERPESHAELEARYRARSLWLDGLAEPLVPRPSLAGDVDCDVAVVGAGFTGLWTAYYLKTLQPDLRVTIVEREIVGYGPAGRNGGWVVSGVPGSASAYGVRKDGAEMTRAHEATELAVDEVGRVVVLESIDCGYAKEGSIIVATSEPQRDRLGNYAGREVIDAVAAERHVRIPGVLAASYSEHAARVNPAALARGLARGCERLGITIHEQTEAFEFGEGQVRCAEGMVRADLVLGATESYTTQLAGEHRRYLPLYSFMIASEPLPDSVWDKLGWRDGLLVQDMHHHFFYAQRTPDGRIAIGGRGAPYKLTRPISEANERSRAVKERLTGALRRHFAAAADARVTHHWGGPLAVPRDWSMSVNYSRERGYCQAGGYSGGGLAASNIAGRTLADLVLGRDTDLVTLPWVGHQSRRWEPEPLRYLASRLIVSVLHRADYHEDTTGRTSRLTRLVAPFMPPK